MNDLRTAAQQALEALEVNQWAVAEQAPHSDVMAHADAITKLRAALAESERDWSLLEATQESLREHMAEIQQMRATLAQALAAMDTCVISSDGEDSWFDPEQVYAARNAARAVMAQPATIAEWWAAKQAASGEPVAHLWQHAETGRTRIVMPDQIITVDASWRVVGPLYLGAAPQPAPARVPLTDEQIDRISAEQWGRGLGAFYAAYRAYARAVEAAHGIAAPGAPDAQPKGAA